MLTHDRKNLQKGKMKFAMKELIARLNPVTASQTRSGILPDLSGRVL